MPLVFAPFILLLVAWAAFSLVTRGLDATERRYAAYGLAAHAGGTVALVAFYTVINTGGDMVGYFSHGTNIGRLLWYDPEHTVPEVVHLLLHQDCSLPAVGAHSGSSTGSMLGLAGLCCFLVGDSIYATCLLVSILAYVGQMGVYRAVRASLAPNDRRVAMLSVLFIPSAIFWTSGILKEAFVMGFLGIFLSSFERIARGKSFFAIFPLVVGAAGVGLLKPYVLFPLVLGIGAWFYAGRDRKPLSLATKVVVVLFAVGGVFAMMRLFPEFDQSHLGEHMQTQREAALRTEAESNIDIGSAEKTLTGQLGLAPLALVNTLARPFIFEVKNPAMLLAAIELTIILWLMMRLFVDYRFAAIVAEVRRTPLLLAAFVFVIAFATGVGLGTTNMGTLSRYRIPMMPAYLTLVLVLRQRLGGATARVQQRTPGVAPVRKTRRVVIPPRIRH